MLETVSHSNVTHLNPAQAAVVERGLLSSGFDCVLQMPTGSGKTWLAERAIEETLQRGDRAVYLTPLRALANELLDRWSARFAGSEVGVFTGEYGSRAAPPVPFERARVLVMTPERLDACTRHWREHWKWIPEVGLLVVDELHLLGEPARGPRLEGALSRFRRLNPFAPCLALSATLGNRAELADWLGGVHFASEWRATPLTWRIVRYRKATEKPDLLKTEVQRCVAAKGQSLVFVQSRRRAETLSRELAEAGLPAGHHHAGLEGEERRRLEGDFRRGKLRVLVSTGTLEMGLNLPARQVVLYDLQRFDGTDFVPLSVNTVWQRAGRAGRRGLDAEGEVVLLAPTWDRTAERYTRGSFEAIHSGLRDVRALAEQVVAEVASGFVRTRPQLQRTMALSLAGHQGRLAHLGSTVASMLDGGLLREVTKDGQDAPILRATRLGRIAVRQMLTPETVVHLARRLLSEGSRTLTLFDLLLLCAQTDDCEPRIPADFEELDDLGQRLSRESSEILRHPVERGASGRRVLAQLKTALVARAWTRTGNEKEVADDFGCYAFEVRRLTESFERILAAAVAMTAPEKGEEESEPEPPSPFDEGPTLHERLRALAAMVAHGLDEETVTLTFVPGIGGKTAKKLRRAGIGDIEALACAEPEELVELGGISHKRASSWISKASESVRHRSAYALRELGARTAVETTRWPKEIDPYRLRRAMDLKVRKLRGTFEVTGGLEPHQVSEAEGRFACDCPDHARSITCKHVLAVRFNRKDPELQSLIERLRSEPVGTHLDLFQLWLEGGRT